VVKETDIIEEHIIIRGTIGYKELSKVPVMDVPKIISFLRIVHNYLVMKEIEKK
jgi:hypothetical protein